MRQWIKNFFMIWVGILVFTGLTNLLKTDNPERELLDSLILVNEHNGLSDWGLEQLDQLLDYACAK